MHQFSELEEKKEMQDEFTGIHSDLTLRQDNVNWIVIEQKVAHFPAGRGRTMMIENKSYSVVVGIMIWVTHSKSPTTPLTQLI